MHSRIAEMLLVAVSGCGLVSGPTIASEGSQILADAGTRGGLIVVVGCERPSLLAELRAGESYHVLGLDKSRARVLEAREQLLQRGAYGPITAATLNGSALPLRDASANLVVFTGSTSTVSGREAMRVLIPGGVLVDLRGEKAKIRTKQDTAARDEWTHYLYDGSNNAVSKDLVVAPPRGLQWMCGPSFARSHEHAGSVSAMISAGGRVFYIIDEGPISSIFLPPKWTLVARDAFNGVLLWKRPLGDWESPLRGFRSGPPDIGRRIVAADGALFVALSYGGPVTQLDPATGQTLRELKGTHGARELLHRAGVLYVLADDLTAEDHNRRKQWIESTAPALTSYQFPPRAILMEGNQRLMAWDVSAARVAWTREIDRRDRVLPTTLAVA